MACHGCPANTESTAGARLMSLRDDPRPTVALYRVAGQRAVRRITQFLPSLIGLAPSCGLAGRRLPYGERGAREPRLRIGAASARRCCGSCWPGNRRNPLFRRSGCRPNDLRLKIGAAAALAARRAHCCEEYRQASRRRHGDADPQAGRRRERSGFGCSTMTGARSLEDRKAVVPPEGRDRLRASTHSLNAAMASRASEWCP
jgi:hypothetical protein